VPEQEAWQIMCRIRAASQASEVQLTPNNNQDNVDSPEGPIETFGLSTADIQQRLSMETAFSSAMLANISVDSSPFPPGDINQSILHNQQWGNTEDDPSLMYRSRLGDGC
jgi:hypothetical protein